MGRIYRKQMVEGIDTPGIIHNGSYFFVRIGVYEDGIISCWHKSDLRQFQNDLNKGWVTPNVPTGELLNIHGLGGFQVQDARWMFDSNGFYRHIRKLVEQMNPEMANIYQTSQREIDKWGKYRVSWSATPIPCKLRAKPGYQLDDGSTIHIFYRTDNTLYLTGLTVFADKTLQIESAGDRCFTLEEIDGLFESGVLCTAPKCTEWVHIDGLGELLLACGKNGTVPIREKRKEITELVKRMAGEPDARDRCMQAYYQYLVDPCGWTREKLREAYEAVPAHERIYLGDMDTRDSDFIRILFSDQKREV